MWCLWTSLHSASVVTSKSWVRVTALEAVAATQFSQPQKIPSPFCESQRENEIVLSPTSLNARNMQDLDFQKAFHPVCRWTI